jgi:hypothetical protein
MLRPAAGAANGPKGGSELPPQLTVSVFDVPVLPVPACDGEEESTYAEAVG